MTERKHEENDRKERKPVNEVKGEQDQSMSAIINAMGAAAIHTPPVNAAIPPPNPIDQYGPGRVPPTSHIPGRSAR